MFIDQTTLDDPLCVPWDVLLPPRKVSAAEAGGPEAEKEGVEKDGEKKEGGEDEQQQQLEEEECDREVAEDGGSEEEEAGGASTPPAPPGASSPFFSSTEHQESPSDPMHPPALPWKSVHFGFSTASITRGMAFADVVSQQPSPPFQYSFYSPYISHLQSPSLLLPPSLPISFSTAGAHLPPLLHLHPCSRLQHRGAQDPSPNGLAHSG